MSDNEPLESQVERLAQFIMEEVPGEPSRSEGAIDTAIRVIRSLQAERDELVLRWAQDAGHPIPLTEGGTKMVCVDCGSANLSENVIDGVEYDWCEDCGTEVETKEVPA